MSFILSFTVTSYGYIVCDERKFRLVFFIPGIIYRSRNRLDSILEVLQADITTVHTHDSYRALLQFLHLYCAG